MAPTWGMSQRLPRRIGVVKAKELMFSARTIDGPEAVAIGLANRCVPGDRLLIEATALAREFLENSWHTLRSDKWLVNQGQNRTLADGLRFEREEGPGSSPDLAERLDKFGR